MNIISQIESYVSLHLNDNPHQLAVCLFERHRKNPNIEDIITKYVTQRRKIELQKYKLSSNSSLFVMTLIDNLKYPTIQPFRFMKNKDISKLHLP